MTYDPHYFQNSDPERFARMMEALKEVEDLKPREFCEAILTLCSETGFNMAGGFAVNFGNALNEQIKFVSEVNDTMAEGMRSALDLLMQHAINLSRAQHQFREEALGIPKPPDPFGDMD